MNKQAFIEMFERVDAKGNPAFIMLNKRLRAYRYIPGFTANHLELYLYLLDRKNPETGYAFPNYYQMVIELNSSTATINKGLKKLEEVGLIQIEKGHRGNNIYFVNEPLPIEQFYERFPEAVEALEKKIEATNKQAAKDKERLKGIKAKQQQAQQQQKVEPKKEDGKVEIPQVDDDTLKAMLYKASINEDGAQDGYNDRLKWLFNIYPNAETLFYSSVFMVDDPVVTNGWLDAPTPDIWKYPKRVS